MGETSRKVLPPGAAGQVVHTATVWMRALAEPPTDRHKNLQHLKKHLDVALSLPDAVAYCDWPAPKMKDPNEVAPRSGPDVKSHLDTVFAELGRACKRRSDAGDDQRAPEAYRAIIGLPTSYLLDLLDDRPSAADPAGVTLSVGFLRYSDSMHIHLGLSLWSRPSSGFGFGWSDDNASSVSDVSVLKRFRTLGQAWQDALEERFWIPPYTVERRPYHPPVLWGVPSAWLDDDGASRLRSRWMLSVSTLEARSVHVSEVELTGRYRVHRRVNASEGGGIRPLYVLSAIDGGNEEEIRQLVETLSQTEASLAHPMWDLENGVQMDRYLLEAYDAAASRGAALWDRLAMLIPVAGRSQLASIHRQVRLLHQTLLQGVSDVEDVAKHVADSVSDLSSAHSDAHRRFHDRLVEVSSSDSGAGGLYDDLISTGYAADVDQAQREVDALAQRVRTRYAQLFQAVAGAVEDRRAREFEVLQRFAFVIALALTAAVISFASGVLGDLVNQEAERWASVGVAAVLLVGLLCWLTYTVASGAKLGSGLLNEQLGRVQQVMSAGSTFELALRDGLLTQELKGRGLAAEERRRQQLQRHDAWDATLVHDLAEAWDSSVAEQFCRGRRGQPLKAVSTSSVTYLEVDDALRVLEDRVGRWMLQTLLTTERPRRTYSPALPRVCLLYRVLDLVRSEPSWVTASIRPAAAKWIGAVPACVGDQEVEFMMAHAFPHLSRADSQSKVDALVEALKAQARDSGRPSAKDALAEIEGAIESWR